MFRKVRFYYLLGLAVLKKQWREIALFIFLLILLGIGSFSLVPLLSGHVISLSNKIVKPVYYEAIVGKPETFNPLFSKTEAEKEINYLVFRGLMNINGKGHLEGVLAKSYKIKSDTVYEF